MKRYAVYPGYVTSENDGERHFIGARSLMNLYRVDPRECVIVYDDEYVGTGGYERLKNLIPLWPHYNG